MILGKEPIPWTSFDVLPAYKHQLIKFCDTIDELEFALERFRHNTEYHCCIRIDSIGKKFAIYTKGLRIKDDKTLLKSREDI